MTIQPSLAAPISDPYSLLSWMQGDWARPPKFESVLPKPASEEGMMPQHKAPLQSIRHVDDRLFFVKQLLGNLKSQHGELGSEWGDVLRALDTAISKQRPLYDLAQNLSDAAYLGELCKQQIDEARGMRDPQHRLSAERLRLRSPHVRSWSTLRLRDAYDLMNAPKAAVERMEKMINDCEAALTEAKAVMQEYPGMFATVNHEVTGALHEITLSTMDMLLAELNVVGRHYAGLGKEMQPQELPGHNRGMRVTQPVLVAPAHWGIKLEPPQRG